MFTIIDAYTSELIDPGDGDPGYRVWRPETEVLGAIDCASIEQIAASDPTQPRGWHIALVKDLPPGLAGRGGIVLGEHPTDAKPGDKERQAIGDILGYVPAGDTLADWIVDLCTFGGDPAGLDRPFPFRPTIQKNIEVWLGGLLHRRKFVYGTDPMTALIKDTVQRQLNAIRVATLDGKTSDPELHLKVADKLCEEYVGFDVQAKADFFAEIKPVEWAAEEQPKKHGTSYTDAFTEGSNTVLSAHTPTGGGFSWATVTNDPTCRASDDVLVPNITTSPSRSRAEVDLASDSMYAFVTCSAGTTNTGRSSGPCARFNSGADTCYYAAQFGGAAGSGTFQLFKNEAGAMTALGTGTSQTIAGVKKLNCSGSTHELYHAGSLVETISDSVISGNLRGGLSLVTTNQLHTLDLWEMGDLAAGAGAGPIFGGRAFGKGRIFGGSALTC